MDISLDKVIEQWHTQKKRRMNTSQELLTVALPSGCGEEAITEEESKEIGSVLYEGFEIYAGDADEVLSSICFEEAEDLDWFEQDLVEHICSQNSALSSAMHEVPTNQDLSKPSESGLPGNEIDDVFRGESKRKDTIDGTPTHQQQLSLHRSVLRTATLIANDYKEQMRIIGKDDRPGLDVRDIATETQKATLQICSSSPWSSNPISYNLYVLLEKHGDIFLSAKACKDRFK
ncbi:hypothetical protein BWQ96_05971 [Gracilariopsis chorda]|uniref:Uncharacterized protein n=1 Tax=Gracilariopsis chorda TaxID=448386 RepID=A0A2V3IRB5_9FLOR|nr:hypothetical protein BWQ96_05971 [Gracilariopsis chorda]|eukprot:PXF44267.1 hypothetical protein BWQ96_05971 [Gracilariopsis chorda]